MTKQVKYFVAILTNQTELLTPALSALEKYFGKPDYNSNWFNFTFTNFYEPEMGKDLKRCIVSFEKLLSPALLPQAKKWTQEVEQIFKETNGNRKVNIDAGYLDFTKVVLASGKHGGHKIALTDDCYADMILDFAKGDWHPFPWTFPDFAKGTYNRILLEMREIYRRSPQKASDAFY